MRSVAAAAVLLVPLVLVACTEEGTGPLHEEREPGAISISAADIELDDGDTLQVFANVLDQHDNVFSSLPDDVELNWTSGDGDVVTVTPAGRVIGMRPGTTTVRAETDGGLFAVATVRVRPVAQGITIVAGNDQDGLPNSPLPDSVTLRVLDRHGNGVAGAEVRFRVVSGGGSISPSYATADATGDVKVLWTLGPVIGDQQMQAFSAGAGTPVAIDATISQVVFGGIVFGGNAVSGGTLAGNAIVIDSNLFPTAIGAAHVTLRWDPTRLQLVPASLTAGDYTRAIRWYDNTAGVLHVVSTDPDMTRGQRAVAGLSFNVIGAAGSSTMVTIDIEQLVGVNFMDASAAGVGGSVQLNIN